jgi:uncharacterized membrane protein YhiD involved in acid resistance|tara:strand:- start:338 stop:826 length:489 start_codon:yes stop_codon:yes gene_type:complete
VKLIDKPLTEQQKRFAELYVYEKGVLSNYEVAIAAGYAQKSAYQRAYELLNPDICPHVVRYIEKLKSEMNEKYRCDFETHKKELWQLREMAKKKNNVQTAVRAEELRGKAAGLYVDRLLTANKNMSNLDNLSMEELEEKIKYYRKTWGIEITEEDKDEVKKK